MKRYIITITFICFLCMNTLISSEKRRASTTNKSIYGKKIKIDKSQKKVLPLKELQENITNKWSTLPPHYNGDKVQGSLRYFDINNVNKGLSVKNDTQTPELVLHLRSELQNLFGGFSFNSNLTFDTIEEEACDRVSITATNNIVEYFREGSILTINGHYQDWTTKQYCNAVKALSDICDIFAEKKDDNNSK